MSGLRSRYTPGHQRRVVFAKYWGLVCVFLVGGCGYAYQELFPTEVRTVAVPIFENKSFYQGVEFDLTEALIKEIEIRTPYKVTAASKADTILQGIITSIDQSRLSRQSVGGVPQELEVKITVDFIWKNLHTGKILRRRQGFESVGRYIPTQPISETLSIGQHEAVYRTATEIVSVMASDW